MTIFIDAVKGAQNGGIGNDWVVRTKLVLQIF